MATKTNVPINDKSYYKVYYEAGVDSNGKRVRKQFYGKSKKEAEAKKQAYIEKNNLGIVDKKLFLGSAMKSWLFEVVKLGQIKTSSFARYEGIYSKYFNDSPISHIQISKLESIDIQRYYNKLFKAGKSSNVINNANKLLKQFLNYCVDNSYIVNNPCNGKK
ncbi:hypothetical protein [Clostridium sp. HBUAS56017]|uniref:hypothetical protein n=1 Tax=Clostridium sp. HBUAS56017 TaxID=2571128 RepID=UPI001FA95960|nr:hypothetical protein [Clostridium sp. HBUAS56017]